MKHTHFLTFLLIALFFFLLPTYGFCDFVKYTNSQAARIWMDGNFSDWDDIPILYQDQTGDQQSGDIDFGVLKAANDERFLYIYIEIGEELNLQDNNEITLYLDTDNNASTGIPFNGIGAEVKWIFGNRQGVYTSRYTIYHQYIGLVTAPTVTSDRFEIAIDRTISLFGQQLFPLNSFRIAFHDDGPGNDYLPNIGEIVSYSFDNSTLPPIESISLKKTVSSDFRAMSYNVLSNHIFEPSLYDNFDRILSAIDPDIIAFEEIYDHTSNDVKQLVESMLPSGTGEQWYCQGIYGDDIYAVSRFPINGYYVLNKSAAFLIDLNPCVDSDLLFIVAHLSFGDYNTDRQLEIDELMAFIRDAKEPGGVLTLEEFTPIIITGDLNLVGYAQQLETLITGDIVNPQFGPDFSPDWDGSDFGDLCARLTDIPMFYTWYSATSSYYPGRLDFMIYSDYVLVSERKFVLFTQEMNADTLNAYGLYADDVPDASDHCPIVSDFTVTQPGLTSIYDIQHTTDPGPEGTYPSLLVDQTITTSGIVTAVGYGGYTNDFFISSPEGNPWEGVYIYFADVTPSVGDMVEITGDVYEYYGFTELRYASVTVISSGNPVPEPILTSTGDLVDPVNAEAYECCLIKVENVTVTQAPNPDNEWYIDDGTGECQVDDGMFAYPATLGEEFTSVIGVLDYSWDEYGINPRDMNDLQVYSVDEPDNENLLEYQIYPNPFADTTRINFSLHRNSHVNILIYNINGQLVEKILDAELTGSHTVEWNSSDAKPGIYFCKIKTDDHSYTKKMILMR
jgi:hypothetical protein